MAKRIPKKPHDDTRVALAMAFDPISAALAKAQDDATASAPSITCAADLIPFVQIPSPIPGKGLIPFERYPFQVDVLKYWTENKSTCMLKDRQMGISWLCALDCLFDLGWKSYQNICSLNYEKEQAAELIWRMQILWSTLPKSWRPAIHFTLEEARAMPQQWFGQLTATGRAAVARASQARDRGPERAALQGSPFWPQGLCTHSSYCSPST